MATDSKDIELRVRARDYSGKTLDNVTKALADLEKAQEAQLKSAKAGASSARELERSYSDIEKAVEALVKQSAVIRLFNEQAAALDNAKKAADAARVASTDYANALSKSETKSKDQIKAQKDLATAVRNTERAQRSAQDRIDATTKRLGDYGIAVDQVGAAQQRIVSAVNSGNAALDKQSAALNQVDANIRQAVIAQNAKAAAARAAQAVEEDWRKQRSNMIDVQARLRAADEAGAKAEKAMTDAMRISGQQAEANAKGYATLARAVTSVRGDELANQLRSVIDPTATANRTINGPVKDFKNTMQALETAQRGAVGIATQIDAYQRQIAVIKTARAEYAAARTSVLELGRQLQAGGGDATALGRALTQAQTQLRGAATAMQQELTVARDLRTALREAGVQTNDLGNAQQKLIGQVNSATNSVNVLSDAYKKNGAAVDTSRKSMFKWMDDSRTTLSFTQRLRGELLALGTAYVGIQGGINMAKGALDAYRTSQKISAQLGAAVGNDAKLIRQEWDYLMSTANRIGISFREAAPAYAKFAIAAKSFGFNLQETRFVFEKFAEASRVAGLSGSDFEGVLKAVEQMLSKGTIQAEELRGQLGDRLPGAFTIAAREAGLTTAEFSKMMEAGAIGADTVLNIARGLPKQFQGIDEATKSMAAAEARFQNAAFAFQKAVAENGFADAYTDFITKLTALLGSQEGAQLAKALSAGFTAVIDVLKLLVENIDTVKIVLSTLTGLLVAKWAFGAATGVIALLTAMKGLYTMTRSLFVAMEAAGGVMTVLGGAATSTAGGVAILRGALVLLVRMVPLLAALTLGIMAAKFAYDKLKKSKDAAMSDTKATGNGAEGSWSDGGATGSWDGPTEDPGSGGTASKRAADKAIKEAEANQKKLDKAQRTARAKSAKDQLDDRAELIKEEYKMKRDAATTDITDEADRAKVIATINKQENRALLIDKIKFESEHAKAGAAAGDKRVQLAEDIKNRLLAIQETLAKEEDKLDKNSSFEERKASRVAAVAHQYDALRKTISKLAPLDKAAAEAASLKLDTYVKQLQSQEEVKATADEIKKLEKELTDQQTLREQSLQRIKAEYDAGTKSQKDFLAESAAATRAGDKAVTDAAANLQKFADAAVAANAGVISLTGQSDIRTKATLATATSSGTDNKINDEANKLQETAINNLIAKRTAGEELFKAQFELRMISEDQYAAKVNANADTYNAKIAQQVALFQKELEIQREQGVLEGTLNPERLAALDAQIAKMTQLSLVTTNAAKQADTFQLNLNKFVNSGLDAALGSVVDQLTKMAEGTVTFSEGLKQMGIATLRFVAQFLAEIAKAIIKQMILNALANSSNPYVAAAGVAGGGVKSPVLHAGGRVGSSGGRARKVPMQYFANAPKFHSGGLPGLAQNEVPAILQKGEQVLSRDDPNNILNQATKATTAENASQRFVLVDDRSRIPEAMQSAEGERVMLVNLRKNAATVKQILR